MAFLSFSRLLLGLHSDNLTAIVVAASLASSVGQAQLAALGASDHAGSGQLPVGAATAVTSCLRNFTLRNSHGDTSLGQYCFSQRQKLFIIEKLL